MHRRIHRRHHHRLQRRHVHEGHGLLRERRDEIAELVELLNGGEILDGHKHGRKGLGRAFGTERLRAHPHALAAPVAVATAASVGNSLALAVLSESRVVSAASAASDEGFGLTLPREGDEAAVLADKHLGGQHAAVGTGHRE